MDKKKNIFSNKQFWLGAGGGVLVTMLIIAAVGQGEMFQGYLKMKESSTVQHTPLAVNKKKPSALQQIPVIEKPKYQIDLPSHTATSRWAVAEEILRARKINLENDLAHYRDCAPDVQGKPGEMALCWLFAHGYWDPYPDGTFKPENNINRAEAAKLVANVFYVKTTKPLVEMFTDVLQGTWYFDYVMTLVLENKTEVDLNNPPANWYPANNMTIGTFSKWMEKQQGPTVSDKQCMMWLSVDKGFKFSQDNSNFNAMDFEYCEAYVGLENWHNKTIYLFPVNE